MSTTVMERPTFEASSWGDEDDDLAQGPPTPLDAVSPLDDGIDAEGDERRLFDELADELAYASRGLSSTRLAIGHPAYAEILAMGERAIPWLLGRLETPGDRPIWLRLLGSLTQFQPGAGRDTIPEAAAAWVTWGKIRHAR
ncbi:MAG TPA: hypothetical protein VII53_02355 [Solirubrobacteraceae bacterium]